MIRRLACVLALAGCATADGGMAHPPTTPMASESAPLAVEEFRVPARDAGIELYVRNKHPRDVSRFAPEKILLFVHGSTYPAEATFDLPLGGVSWMEWIAQRGYDVYLVDVRGYGRSTRPREMSEPPQAHGPIVTTEVAISDVGSAVDFILRRRSVPKLTLMGWSWGTTTMGAYTARNNDKVARLVLYAPQWLRTTPSLISGEGAWRAVSMDSARDRWLKGVPEDKRRDLIPDGWFEVWAKATLESDPEGARATPPMIRAPNGTLHDTREFWAAGKPFYDPGQIKVPTLIVHADLDQDLPTPMARAVFEKLTSAPRKRFVEIGDGTHTILMEKNRLQLFREVQLFLDSE
ncbi:MAG TPA: alpha/beta hydrolase [Myxococcales bacterium]|jgi:pimeloyl-ACP methyl ester carboxylesterase|nr:alpha/beta hydrolase [Myxococcales bacterium]